MGERGSGSEGKFDCDNHELFALHGKLSRHLDLFFFSSLDELTVPNPLNRQIPPFYQVLDRCDQVLDTQRGLMAVVDFYTSRELGNKERVSPPPLLFFFCLSDGRSITFLYHRPSVQRANVYLGFRNGFGSAGSTLMAFIFTGLDGSTWNTKWAPSRLTMRETTF